MKAIFLSAVLMPLLASGQTSPKAMMLQGLGKIALSQKTTVVATGSEMRGTKLVTVKVSAAFLFVPNKGDVRIEVMTFENGKLVSRQAGDGTSLWFYDAKANTYSSTQYASYDTGLSSNWRQRFFPSLKLRTTGATAYALHVLDSAYGASAHEGAWQPWIPTSAVSRSDNTVVCESDSPLPTRNAYTFTGDDETGFTLVGAAFVQRSSGGKSIHKDWNLEVATDFLPPDTDFGFVPPRGARLVTVEQPQVGG